MSDLPTDAVADILSRLPPKSLLQFRCVSKPWCALIDSPNFIKSHLKRSIETKNNLSLILGLILEDEDEDEDELYSIEKHQKLPVPPIEDQLIVYGFGHDVVNDDYKLVRMAQFDAEDDDSFYSEVKVYNLKSNLWRRIPDFPYYHPFDGRSGMLVSDALHWVVARKRRSDKADLIAAFDIRTEDYSLVPQPEFSDKSFFMNVRVLGECLSISCHFISSARIDIWVMKEYGVKESWTKLFSVAQSLISSFVDVVPIAYSKSALSRLVLMVEVMGRSSQHKRRERKRRIVRRGNSILGLILH
ncbi:hypothetical protein F0562_017327 [Nyssa sinensis]|uniref:F-box domain-containing protein n=1 Tax=Nyssa sinensis TaxID=561372 RepID=A0A5J4ZE09_9ASTE|nr:hypothetical protein F0562_017327 [Nyssa sinensis]